MSTNQIIIPSKEAITQAVVFETNQKYPELNIKPDDPRVIEHAGKVEEFLKAYWKVEL